MLFIYVCLCVLFVGLEFYCCSGLAIVSSPNDISCGVAIAPDITFPDQFTGDLRPKRRSLRCFGFDGERLLVGFGSARNAYGKAKKAFQRPREVHWDVSRDVSMLVHG